jgi:hypothetical protein
MEFEELTRIWDAQNTRPLYTINEEALHNHILLKKSQAHHMSNVSELLLIIVNTGAGIFILWTNLTGKHPNIFLYVLAAWMFSSVIYLVNGRIRRIKKSHQFERSVRGDLNHAISMATYQVHLSRIMRWNILPIGMISVLSIWESGKSIWVVLGTLLFFVFAYFAGGWEHGIYKARRRELQVLQQSLEKEG